MMNCVLPGASPSAEARSMILLQRGRRMASNTQEAGVKIGIIGAGAVGAATVSNLIQPSGVNPEIILIDSQAKKAVGLAEDFSYAAALDSLSTVSAGGYDDLGGADLVIVNAGVNEKDGGATDRND